MSAFVLAPAARDDLCGIWDHIALESEDPDTADRLIDDLFEAMERLSANPGIGHLRNDLAIEPLRFWAVGNYLIIYRDEKQPIEVARVLHGARDVKAVLEYPPEGS